MKILEAVKTRWIVWVWNHTPDCAEMSRLASLSFEQSLSLRLRFQIWLHHLICVWCQRYTRQLHFLHRTAPRLQEEWDRACVRRLSGEAKQRMARRLREECPHELVGSH